MGTPGEEDFLGVDKPKYENKRDRGNRNRNRNRNRNGNWGTINTIKLNTSSPSLPTRGSKKPVTLKVPLLTPGDTRVSFNKS